MATKWERGRNKLGVWDSHIYTTMYKLDNQQGSPFSTGNSTQHFLIKPKREKNLKKMICIYVCACSVTSVMSTLCDPMDCSPPGSSVHGILQARILEWVAMPSSRGSS